MRDWLKYWEHNPKKFKETDFLQQVGKTVKGIPIRDDQLEQLIQQLRDELEIKPSDIVLDLCCGNGLITHKVASLCNSIIGVDYSKPLIKVAQKYHQPANAIYIRASVLDLTPDMFVTEKSFTKVYMYGALQHFSEEDLASILRVIQSVSVDTFVAYFGSVPDKDCIWSFYNTPERRSEYYKRKSEGREAIGTWWDRKVIESIVGSIGYRCIFIEQHPNLHTSHYRFDVKILKERSDKGV
jgi:SAM-dependent methyltransferase